MGNIGSQQRTKYSAVGSDVNRAARVEACTVGGQILITDETLGAAGPDVQVHCSRDITLKGVTTPVTLHEVEGMGGAHDLRLQQTLAPRVELTDQVGVRFWVLTSKIAEGNALDGRLVRLSSREGEIATDETVEPMTDLRFEVHGGNGQPLEGELYGKVVPKSPDGHEGMVVRFTSVPPEIRKFFDKAVLP